MITPQLVTARVAVSVPRQDLEPCPEVPEELLEELLAYLEEEEALNLDIMARLGGFAAALATDAEHPSREEELAASMAQGFLAGKAKAFEEVLFVLDTDHSAGCGCRPCVVARAIRTAMTASPERVHLIVYAAMEQLDDE